MKKQNYISKLLLPVLLVYGAGSLRAQLLPPEPPASVAVDGYAAQVGSRIITGGDVLTLIAPDRVQLMRTMQGAELEKKMAELYDLGLQRLIENALILEEFDHLGGALPTQAVDERVNRIINNRFENNRAAFLQALAEDGVSLSEWREGVQDQLVITLLRRQEVSERVSVSPRQVLAAYEARKDEFSKAEEAQIRLIAAKPAEEEAALATQLAELRALRSKLVQGADFAEAVKAYPEGPKADQGGELGWLAVSDLREEFKKALKEMKPGSISPVIRAPGQIYIFKLEDYHAQQAQPLSEVRDRLEKELRIADEKRIHEEWIGRLKNKYHIKKF